MRRQFFIDLPCLFLKIGLLFVALSTSAASMAASTESHIEKRPSTPANEITLASSEDTERTIVAATAANFATTLRHIAAEFEKRSNENIRVKVVSGSSGKLSAQIINGAPFDIFFSADKENPDRLIAEGKASPGARLTYALGGLALVTSNRAIDKPLNELLTGRFNKLAIANPKLAPYGRASIETLNALGAHNKAKDKLVVGENVMQAFQFVASGNADLGLVALSQIQQVDPALRKRLRIWKVPASLHNPIAQDAVILSRGNRQAAGALMSFVSTHPAENIITANGYSVPNQATFTAPDKESEASIDSASALNTTAAPAENGSQTSARPAFAGHF